MDELAARVEVLLRRSNDSRAIVLQVGPLRLDLIDRSAVRGERMLDLLPTEFKLLEYLMRHAGQTVTRTMLLEDVWHYRFLPQTNLVDVHIGKLRRKVDLDGDAPLDLSRSPFRLYAPCGRLTFSRQRRSVSLFFCACGDCLHLRGLSFHLLAGRNLRHQSTGRHIGGRSRQSCRATRRPRSARTGVAIYK